jgi:hypothetical protein
MFLFRIGRFGAVGIGLIALYFIVAATQGIADHVWYRRPQVVTYDQFVKGAPTSGWYRVLGGWLVIPQGAVVSLFVSQTLYIPLRRPGDTAATPIRILVRPVDPAIISAYDGLYAMNGAPEADREAYVDKNKAKLTFNHDALGLVAHGADYAMLERADLLGELPGLSPDVIVLDEGATPSLKTPLVKLAVGFLLLYLTFRGFLAGNPEPRPPKLDLSRFSR